MNNIMLLTNQQLQHELWKSDPQIKVLLESAASLFKAREKLFGYLNDLERHYFNIQSDRYLKDVHIIEKMNAKECIRVLKNVIRTENEKVTGTSAIELLYRMAKKTVSLTKIQPGFLAEFIFLFQGINARSGITNDTFVLPSDSSEASLIRSGKLDEYAFRMSGMISKYKCGTDPGLSAEANHQRQAILRYFKADEPDWNDYHWHLKHIIKDLQTVVSIVALDHEEREGLEYAMASNVPFQITPYYLSLFNADGKTREDRAIRAQVLPSIYYCKKVIENRAKGFDMDFMGERSTSPVEGITRRYPQIVILKPIDVCPQICVYCQRNWEIKQMKTSRTSKRTLTKAIEWIKANENISEVLITGGDPLILGDDHIEELLDQVSGIGHIERIRIGTRVLVTLPMRITDQLLAILKTYHKPGLRDIAVVTHFEHPAEITQESVNAISKIRQAGISVYNQQVFTYYNSRRFETCALRKYLKLAGIDPYYTFNTKGKEETADFRVPIARIEQERKEEARFMPGIIRTDEPVFNVPKLGKSHLRAGQDHEVIMIRPTGERVFRFYPWESKVTLVDDYIYDDVSIYDYLKRLKNDGEELDQYRSIWYYF